MIASSNTSPPSTVIGSTSLDLDLSTVPTPCFVVDEARLRRNLSIFKTVKDQTGCRILLALKGFSMFRTFPLLKTVLDGTCASSPHEAQLGYEEFGGEVHVFAAAYSQTDITTLLSIAGHFSFNSLSQWDRFKAQLRASSAECGLRINPRHSEVEVAMYDPCAQFSRLGIPAEQLARADMNGITGLHFHNLCEKNADALERTLVAVEKQFGPWIKQMKWMNFGGGHHITRPDYDVEKLCRLINDFKRRYPVQVYLEPGEAVALHTGYLVTTVLDIIHNDMDIAILDTSATCHMPDTLEMPYRPEIAGAGKPGEFAHTYRLGGLSCLAGDVINDYSFKEPLTVGDRLVFMDMGHYSMVKTTTFNGIKLPSIAYYRRDPDHVELVREFGYQDFKSRLS